MSRRDDLIEHIRESYALVRAYEDKVRLSDDPKEVARSRRAIEEQRALIRDWSAELQRLGGLPADLADPALAQPPEAAGASGDASTYTIHIGHAQGLAIGDDARVEQAGGPEPAGGEVTYEAPVLAYKGREQLQSGRYIGEHEFADNNRSLGQPVR